MRHRVKKSHFNRDSKHRQAMTKNLVMQLIKHGQITTTNEKAKVIKQLADKLISKAKKGSVASRRQLHEFFGKRDVVNTLVDRVAPVMSDRQSGFTTTQKVGKRRGDNTEMIKLSLVNQPEEVGTLKNTDKAVKAEPKAKADKTAAKPVEKKETAKPEKAEKKAEKPTPKKAPAKKTTKKEASTTKKATAAK